MKKDTLEIVNEVDEVIGTESRRLIHQKGLLHRETHVLFYTPDGKIIFQHRAKDKDTYPDLLDATVGGHNEIGDSYEKTAIKETAEETGLKIKSEDLHLITKIKKKSHDVSTGATNYAFKCEYAYKFTGSLSDLKIEKGKALGFEAWSIDTLLNMPEKDKEKFIPGTLSQEFLELFKAIRKLVNLS